MQIHNSVIPKGIYGEFSKIEEEFLELKDAYVQDDKIFQICELCDLVGAIEQYSINNWNLDLSDLKNFANKIKKIKEYERK